MARPVTPLPDLRKLHTTPLMGDGFCDFCGRSVGNFAANHGEFTYSGLGRAPAFASLILGLVNTRTPFRPPFVMGRGSAFSDPDSEKGI
jgi:hypothetical protein